MRETTPACWHGKPYYSLDAYCKNVYGEKCYKIAIDAGMTCPNRDGTLGTGGCIFCSAGGSGDFAVKRNCQTIQEQIAEGLSLFGSKKTGTRFIAYFQAYTNTYAPVSDLEALYREALSCPDICGISIATRPDCLPAKVLNLLSVLREEYAPKFIWVELGLQTMHEKTADFIRRGYSLSCFENAMVDLHHINIPAIIHVILGLPGETPEDMYATIQYLNTRQPFGIKLQLLHILKGTDLAQYYETLPVMDMDTYIQTLIHCIELLNPSVTIHRVTGDAPKSLLLAPLWSADKRKVLNTLHHTMKSMNTYQGRNYHASGPIDVI